MVKSKYGGSYFKIVNKNGNRYATPEERQKVSKILKRRENLRSYLTKKGFTPTMGNPKTKYTISTKSKIRGVNGLKARGKKARKKGARMAWVFIYLILVNEIIGWIYIQVQYVMLLILSYYSGGGIVTLCHVPQTWHETENALSVCPLMTCTQV